MWKWIYSKLCRWIRCRVGIAPYPFIEYRSLKDSKSVVLKVTGSKGLMLVGVADNSVRLISSSEVVDPTHWWELWNYYNRGASIEWEE